MANEFFDQWEQPESESRLDMVFADRNKDYGAYRIRLGYRRAKVVAVLIACSFMALLSSVPLIDEIIRAGKEEHKGKVKVETKTFDDVKEPEEKKKKVEVPPPPAPPVATQQFAKPNIDPDKEESNPPPPNKDIEKPGRETQKGKDDNPYEQEKEKGGPFETGGLDQGVAASVDVEAQFDGGMAGFAKYVQEAFVVPTDCTEEGGLAIVQLRFMVDQRGRVSNVTIVEDRSTCKPFFAEEAKRVLENSPLWTPGFVKGMAVRSYRIVPIRLNLGGGN